MVRDKGCAFPGCTHTRYLHGHHIKHWLHGGETSTANTVLLCSHHHRLVHEGGWDVSHDTRSGSGGNGSDTNDGGFLFHMPDGRILERNPRLPQIEDIDRWLGDWADKHGLDLSPEANEPQWDGSRPNYAYVIEGLFED